jgi:hypothetical protein
MKLISAQAIPGDRQAGLSLFPNCRGHQGFAGKLLSQEQGANGENGLARYLHLSP